MSACNAIEAACGAVVEGPLADLRRLLYLGEWIESHVLHIYLLHAPDFLGYESAIELADRPSRPRAARSRSQEGRQLAGGARRRARDPPGERPSRWVLPRSDRSQSFGPFVPRLEQARDLALDTVRWVADFDFPDHTWTGELAALRRPANTPSPVVASPRRSDSTSGPRSSTTMSSRNTSNTPLRFMPVCASGASTSSARLRGSQSTRASSGAVAQDAANGRRPHRRRAQSVSVDRRPRDRGAARVRRGSGDHRPVPAAGPSRCRGGAPRGVGHGWTEAPRGMLWHRYELAEDGAIVAARIVPPTSQNQAGIERDLFQFVEHNLGLEDEELAGARGAGHPKLRPVHLVRDPLPRPHCRTDMTRPLLVGIGNPWRGDDGIGWAVAEAVRRRLGDAVDVAWCDGEPTRLLDAWDDSRLRCRGRRSQDRRCHRARCTSGRRAADDVGSSAGGSHALGVAYALALGHALDRVPERLAVIGIEAATRPRRAVVAPRSLPP